MNFLEIIGSEKISSSGNVFDIKKYYINFTKFISHNPFSDLSRTYTIKPLVSVFDEACFPEIALLNVFKNQGWDGVWMDSFHRKIWHSFKDEEGEGYLPKKVKSILRNINGNDKYTTGGVWDLVLWRDDEIMFVESKGRPSNDAIRKTQIEFLKRALYNNLSIDCFVIVEWDYLKEE